MTPLKQTWTAILTVLVFAGTATSARAGHNVSTVVANVRSDANANRAYVYFPNANTNAVDCGNPNHHRLMSIDLRQQGGKAAFSLLLAAQLSGKKVHAHGTGTCSTLDPSVEALYYVLLVN